MKFTFFKGLGNSLKGAGNFITSPFTKKPIFYVNPDEFEQRLLDRDPSLNYDDARKKQFERQKIGASFILALVTFGIFGGVKAGGATKKNTMEATNFWGDLANDTLSGVGSYFQNKEENKTAVQTAQINSSAIQNGVKYLALALALGFVVKLIFGKK